MATQGNIITSQSENITNVSVEAITEGDVPTLPQSNNGEDSSTTEKISIDNIEIKLEFDLGNISLSLAQIKQLSLGVTFTTGRPLERSVNISSNGQRLAIGELVDIDGIVGVKVLNFFKQNNG